MSRGQQALQVSIPNASVSGRGFSPGGYVSHEDLVPSPGSGVLAWVLGLGFRV